MPQLFRGPVEEAPQKPSQKVVTLNEYSTPSQDSYMADELMNSPNVLTEFGKTWLRAGSVHPVGC